MYKGIRTDATLFKFLEQYLRRLEGPLAVQVWGRYIQLVKELLSTSRDFKVHQFMALRLISVVCKSICLNLYYCLPDV